jgi:hypothetical protein
MGVKEIPMRTSRRSGSACWRIKLSRIARDTDSFIAAYAKEKGDGTANPIAL